VVHEVKKLKMDLIVATETKRKGQGSENVGEYDHFFSGVPKEIRAQKGVSILIHRRFRKNITSWEAINERIIKLNIDLFGARTTIIGVYGVNEDENINVKDTFYEQLNNQIINTGSSRELILLGDFNARTGRKDNNKVVGKYGEEIVNSNGERLISICEQNDLKILNGHFPHKEIHKFTWKNDTRQQKSIIDYIIAKQKTFIDFQDVKACRGPTCSSDHYLLKTKIYIKARKKENSSQRRTQNQYINSEPKKYNLKGLDEESTKWLYRNRLDEKLQENLAFESPEKHYQHIKDCIHGAALEALGKYEETRTAQKPYWWDDEIEKDIEDKRKKHQQYLSSRKTEHKLAYKEAQTRVREKIVVKKNESWEKQCKRIDTYLGGKRNTESWRILKNMRKNRKKDIITTISTQQWESYFKELLTEERPQFKEEPYTQNLRTMGSPVRITIEEVKKQSSFLKNNRAPGPGDIYGELIKYGSNKLFYHLAKLFQTCINKQEVPEEWKESHLTTIFKKGDRNKCDNYRGIAVTNTVSRVYGKILKMKIEKEYQNNEAEEQAGFRSGRSTIDHLFTITQIIEKKVAYDQELHLLFVDIKKAYDSVPLNKLWKALETTNINVELIKAVKTLYGGAKTKIKQGKIISHGFMPTKGLKQGCCLSPTLFKIFLEQALNEWKQKCRTMGLPLNENTLYTLSFADDQVVISQDYEDLEYMTRKLIEQYDKWGLEVNLEKTEYMCIGGEQRDLQLNNGLVIKRCTEYKYLGMKLSHNGTLDEAIKDRNTQGRKAISLLNGVLWDRNINRENKTRIYKTIVKSIITYSSEVWPLKDRTTKMLEATEMDFWRRAAGRSRMEKVTNIRIREIMKVKHTIADDIMDKQLVWFGHVQRMEITRIPKQIIEWKPGGRRRRGRPRRSWRCGIDEEIRDRGLEDTNWDNREDWRSGIARRRTL